MLHITKEEIRGTRLEINEKFGYGNVNFVPIAKQEHDVRKDKMERMTACTLAILRIRALTFIERY